MCTRRHGGVGCLSNAFAPDRLGGLRQRAIRRAQASVAIFVALHPPRRDLQSLCPPTRTASPSSPRTIGSRGPPGQDDDAGDRRVHPALPDPCPAERLPPHPTLWAARQYQPSRQHCARSRAARRAVSPKQPDAPEATIDQPRVLSQPCPCCGGRMIIIETFERGCEPKHRPHHLGGDQGRHLMMPSPPINHSYDTCNSRWLSASSAQVRVDPLDCPGRNTNLVVRPASRSFTPTCSHWLCRKPIAATDPVQHHQPKTRG